MLVLAVLELRDPSDSTYQVLGLKVCTTATQLQLFIPKGQRARNGAEACNPSTWEDWSSGSSSAAQGVQGQPGLLKSCLKETKIEITRRKGKKEEKGKGKRRGAPERWKDIIEPLRDAEANDRLSMSLHLVLKMILKTVAIAVMTRFTAACPRHKDGGR